MTLILKVTSTDPRVPLSQLLQLPLGLDVWEVTPDHICNAPHLSSGHERSVMADVIVPLKLPRCVVP
jgi:hypothetical protein